MRSYRDVRGVEWQVWKVTPQTPTFLDRRRADRRQSQSPLESEEERRSADRRRGNIREGWLCFEGEHERVRVHPVPDEWEACSEERLDLIRRTGQRATSRLTPEAANRDS
jgi:hypothetical protein